MLAEEAQAGDGAATEELLLRYKNAVLARARRYFLAGGETDDLVQEGMVGLYFDISAVHSNTSKQGIATITLAFETKGKEELTSLIDKILQVENVIDIERTRG